ncbi:MAG: ATP-dependent sacrificial sulfur transferase LarE [Acidobacteria bacterium]|nr:ATP-dependent sacrificial sulfur transferase LarE [Acidobacteriota bacterium]
MSALAKLARLRAIVADAGGGVVAYSGGADSAFLADVAYEVLRDRMLAVTAVSASLSRGEREAAGRIAEARGWAHMEVETHEIERDGYRLNPPDRCYHCKSELLEVLNPLARERGWPVMVGVNSDDAADFRPGQAAASERGALAPLREAGLGKQEIRELSRERGLATWDKPAAPCLASRIAYGVEVTTDRLERIGRAEAFLRSLGLREFRVRDHGDLARIEVPAGSVGRIAETGVRERVAEMLKGLGFRYVTLDLEGFRSGSMNEVLVGIERLRHEDDDREA